MDITTTIAPNDHHHVDIREACLHPRLQDASVSFGIMLWPGEQEEIDNILMKGLEDEARVQMRFQFSISECVEEVLDMYRMGRNEPPKLRPDERPHIDALRAELQAALARLDQVVFVPE